MMAWWSKLPSLTPVKGLLKFLYIWSTWDEVSAKLDKRDARLKAVEEVARQMIRLKEEAHGEEKRALERKTRDEVDKWRALHDRGGAVIERAMAAMQAMQEHAEELRESLADVAWRLAVQLYFEDSQVRDSLLSPLDPKPRALLDKTLQLVEVRAQKTLKELRSETTSGGMDVKP